MPETVTPRAEDLRIAYFISSYGDGRQLLRLVRTIRRAEPRSPIVVHHDEFGRAPLDRTPFTALGVTIIPGVERIRWGDLSLESARWRVFRWILAELDVDWVMLLSEQDYPIAPFRAFRERLATSGADAIIAATRVDRVADPAERQDAGDRYYYEYRFVPGPDRLPSAVRGLVAPARRVAIGVLRHSFLLNFYRGVPNLGMPDRIGVRVKRRVYPPGFPCWVNDCWFPISTTAIRAVLDHLDTDPEYVRHHERTVIPLESATATILFNHPGLRVENAALHAIRWSDRVSGRPDVLTLADLPFLDASGALFTRKVDLRHTDLLDALDARVFGERAEAA